MVGWSVGQSVSRSVGGWWVGCWREKLEFSLWGFEMAGSCVRLSNSKTQPSKRCVNQRTSHCKEQPASLAENQPSKQTTDQPRKQPSSPATNQRSSQTAKQPSKQPGSQATMQPSNPNHPNHPSKQASKQASRQAGKQASRQAGKQAHRQCPCSGFYGHLDWWVGWLTSWFISFLPRGLLQRSPPCLAGPILPTDHQRNQQSQPTKSTTRHTM